MSVVNGSRTKRSPWFKYTIFAAIGTMFILLTTHSSSPAAFAIAAARERVSAYLPNKSGSETVMTEADFQDPLDWRDYLERTTSPLRQIEHHRTFGFSHIYVLSLPTRLDRRQEMSKLASALGIKITFVDAAHRDEQFLKWIGERVMESRELRRQVMAEARGTKPENIGGLSIGTDWFTPFVDDIEAKTLFPAFPYDERFPDGSWTTHLEHLHDKGKHTALKPYNASIDIATELYDPLEPSFVKQLHEGIISTYWGQTRALKEMVRNGDESALILEDDVDVEWDFERLWSRISTKLPKDDWDATYVGHCWGHESMSPWYLHPLLHPSVAPMCLHGWAVSSNGAQRLLDALLDPWRAFSTAVDLTIPTLIHFDQVRAFSIQPPLVIQRKDGPSDLQKGNGSKWRGVLRDSTVERIARDEGTWGQDEVWEPDPRLWDPATRFREKTACDEFW